MRRAEPQSQEVVRREDGRRERASLPKGPGEMEWEVTCLQTQHSFSGGQGTCCGKAFFPLQNHPPSLLVCLFLRVQAGTCQFVLLLLVSCVSVLAHCPGTQSPCPHWDPGTASPGLVLSQTNYKNPCHVLVD